MTKPPNSENILDLVLDLEDFPEVEPDPEFNMGPMCCRCYDEGELFPANCTEKPELLIGVPLGMYHCPDCGAMLVAGLKHGPLCKRCLNREHPGFDR